MISVSILETFKVCTSRNKHNDLPSLEENGLQHLENLWGKSPWKVIDREAVTAWRTLWVPSGWDGNIPLEDFLGSTLLKSLFGRPAWRNMV